MTASDNPRLLATDLPVHDPLDEDAPDDRPSEALRALLRRAPAPPPSDLLRGVQQKLRVRSEGKFYGDGWSTREENPRSTYLVTALVMLAIVLLLFFALRPYGVMLGFDATPQNPNNGQSSLPKSIGCLPYSPCPRRKLC